MALPILNDTPQYEMTVPSSGQKVKFRPFLVKEQKVLLIAYESQDPRQVMNATLDCLSNCVQDIDVSKLATFDVDYMFTQVRSKSVGESAEVLSKCTSCENENELKIELNEIKVENINKDVIIPINETINIKMKYPSYKDIIVDKDILSEESLSTNKIFSTIRICIDSVMTDEENIPLRDESEEEVERFMNSLTNDQFEKINNFVDNIPKLKYEKEYNCEKCGSKNIVRVEGLQDFFS